MIFVKIMTFNTQHCLNYKKQKIDFQIMADTIKTCGADIVGLNEMRGKGSHPEYENQTEILSHLTGLENYFFAKAIEFKPGPYGNGFLSRYPIKKAEIIPIPDPEPKANVNGYYESRCILKAVLQNGLTVLVVHFGLNDDEQENAVNTVLSNIEDTKCILMGDFNVVPDSRLLIPIRERMKDTADLFKEPLMSFPSDEPYEKIDYIFVSRDIEAVSADIPPIVASDHRPYVCEIKF